MTVNPDGRIMVNCQSDYREIRDRGLTADMFRAENGQPERLMFPFTISTSGGLNARTYTICTA